MMIEQCPSAPISHLTLIVWYLVVISSQIEF